MRLTLAQSPGRNEENLNAEKIILVDLSVIYLNISYFPSSKSKSRQSSRSLERPKPKRADR